MKSRKKKESIFQNRSMIFPVSLIFGSMLLLFSDMGIIKWYELRQKRRHIQMEIDLLINKEKDLTAELDRLKNDDDYIKKIAQERFHMIKPGEKIFRVVDRRKIKKDK